jgi:hypothetical protein
MASVVREGGRVPRESLAPTIMPHRGYPPDLQLEQKTSINTQAPPQSTPSSPTPKTLIVCQWDQIAFLHIAVRAVLAKSATLRSIPKP